MGMLRRIVFTSGVIGTGAGCYCIYAYWNKISIFPAETRKLMRDALHAERAGFSGDAEGKLHDALESSIIIMGQQSDSTRSILLKMADFYRQRGRIDRVIKIYESILETDNLPDQLRLGILKALGDLFVENDQLEHGSECFRSIELLIKRLELEKKPAISGPIYESLGDLNFKRKDYDEAIRTYKIAVDLCKQDHGCGDKNYLNLLNNIASCQFAKQTESSVHEARETARAALHMARGLAKEHDIKLLISNLNLILNS